jgi:hypothetical protein
VALWAPDGPIDREEMEAARGAFAYAAANSIEIFSLDFDDGRHITFTRHQFSLPLFVESPDWRDAVGLTEIFAERAFEALPN